MNTSKNLISIGRAVSLIQAPHDVIRLTAEQLGIVPELTINSVQHFAESDIERIGQIIHNQPCEVSEMQRRGRGLS